MRSARPGNSTSLSLLANAVLAALALVLLVSACSASAESEVTKSDVTESDLAESDSEPQAQAVQGETDQPPTTQADTTQTEADSEPVPDTAATEQSATPGSLTAAECEALDTAQIKLLFAGGLVLVDAVSINDLDLAELEELIDIWRPYQDVPGLLGTARQDLDNLSNDFLAASEGRLDDLVSDGPFGRLTKHPRGRHSRDHEHRSPALFTARQSQPRSDNSGTP